MGAGNFGLSKALATTDDTEPHMLAWGVITRGASHRNPEPSHPVQNKSPRTHCSPRQAGPVSPRPVSLSESGCS